MQQISEMSFKKSSFLMFQYKTKELTSNLHKNATNLRIEF